MEGLKIQGDPRYKKDGGASGMGYIYKGLVDSPAISGEVQLTTTEEGLLISSLFERVLLPYADIDSFVLQDYAVRLRTADGCYTVTRLGKACGWFYRELYGAYDKCTLKAFAVEGAPVMETRGVFETCEPSGNVSTQADIRLYKDCLCAMTPDIHARRIPLLFINGMDKADYSLTVSLSTGEQYTFARLGHDTEPFEQRIAAQITAFREKAAALVMEQNPTLDSCEVSRAAQLCPNGTAAPLAQLYSTLPCYAKAVEQHIRGSKIAGTYELLKSVGDASKFCVGAKFIPVSEESGPIVWAIAFNGKGDAAAVELALQGEESAATYLYHTGGNNAGFLAMLNRALEATGFRREAILLPKEELGRDKYALQRILLARTPWLGQLRKAFAGRVIHSSAEGWKKGILKYFG